MLTPEERTHLRFLRTFMVAFAIIWLALIQLWLGWPAMVMSAVFSFLVAFAVYVHATLRSLS